MLRLTRYYHNLYDRISTALIYQRVTTTLGKRSFSWNEGNHIKYSGELLIDVFLFNSSSSTSIKVDVGSCQNTSMISAVYRLNDEKTNQSIMRIINILKTSLPTGFEIRTNTNYHFVLYNTITIVTDVFYICLFS